MSAPQGLTAARNQIESGHFDTVIIAVVDLQGRLAGKRLTATHFLDEIAVHGAEACAYILATDVDMTPVPGYPLASWESGYGDLTMMPDLTRLWPLPWHPGTVLVFADAVDRDGREIAIAPRQVLREQLDRANKRGLRVRSATELEFLAFRDNYQEASARDYRDLRPLSRYNTDYSILGTAEAEPLLRDIRNQMTAAGLVTESAKGECNLGQFEVVFRFADAMTSCDSHVIYKEGAKVIAARHGLSLTFMAKFDEREGNSCHLHMSLADDHGTPLFPGPGGGPSRIMEHFLAGQLALLREFALCYAPTVNSYKRYQPRSFAPTSVTWGTDNRTASLRVTGSGTSLRVENRVPGGDANAYLATAAMIAAGLHGIENELTLTPEVSGNAYADTPHSMPRSLGEALSLWEASEAARASFGADVVAHYANMARVEITQFEAAVTDWERRRYFERL